MESRREKLKIAKEAAKIKLDSTGMLTIKAAIRQAERNFNRLNGLNQIIKCVEGEDND